MKQTSIKVYLYADLLSQKFGITDYDYWYDKKYKETGFYQSPTAAFKLIEVLEISLLDYQTFDFTTGKIQALENQLGNLHIQAENIKAQIQELLSIGYESSEEKMKDKILGDEDYFNNEEFPL